jgi:hypothetical protein
MEAEKKLDYIINPLSGRIVKIGSPTYRKLIKDAVIADETIRKPKPEKKKQVVVAKTSQPKELKSRLPPAPEGKNYIAMNDKIVLRDKKTKGISPEKYSKLFSRASVIVNKKMTTDPELSKLLKNVNSVDELPEQAKQKIEQMLLEEVLRIPEKSKPSTKMNIVIPSPQYVKKTTQYKKDYSSESEGYNSAYSVMSDDIEMKSILKQKKSNNKTSKPKKNGKQKLITIISAQPASRPTAKNVSVNGTDYETSTTEYSSYYDEESGSSGSETDSSSESDA